MKKKIISMVLTTAMAAAMLAGCGSSTASTATTSTAASAATTSTASSTASKAASTATSTATSTASKDSSVVTTASGLKIGFAQVGAESDWRTACTASIKDTFSEANGFTLLFDDAQQKQENQITAIRNFIQQEVDYIVLDPVTETGWDTVLQEAKDADIPVIVVDRQVDVSDDSLYTCAIGSDFKLEGDKACAWLDAFLTAKGITDTVNIVDIQGTIGASAQIGRTQGLEDAVKAHSNWNLLAETTGEFTQAKGQEVMESFLKQYDNINVVYAENDNEAFGAIDAIKAAGKTVGSDIKNGQIMVMTFDSTKAGLTDALDGSITLDTECNPLYGPKLQEMIGQLQAGKTLDKMTYIDESMFSADTSVTKVTVSGTDYPITALTQSVIDSRSY